MHFVHNAEYIAFYPNMPVWITRQTVYVVWLAISSVGVVGVAFALLGWRALAVVASRFAVQRLRVAVRDGVSR